MDERQKARDLVKEVFHRSAAGVFAILYPHTHDLCIDWKSGADGFTSLGLASRLQQECFANLVAEGDGDRKTTEAAVQSNVPITDADDLSLVTLEAMIAELYRIDGAWVLGLRRPRKVGNDTFWEGMLWNGPGLTCMGMAAAIQHCISDKVAQEMDQRCDQRHPPALPERTAQIVRCLYSLPKPDPLQIGGLSAHMAYEAARLRPIRNGPGNTLQEFLDGAPPATKTRQHE